MKTAWFFAALLVLACSETGTKNGLQHLSGYWEIEKVVFPGGATKEYTISPAIDYFEIRPDSSGFRKKLEPQFNGRFLSTDDAESFRLKTVKNELKIRYKTALDAWQETILTIDENRLIIKNKDNLTYFYKRFIPIEINP